MRQKSEVNIKQLLSRFLSKEINSEEWELLKNLLNETDDYSLLMQLEKIWETYTLNEKNTPNEEDINHIFSHIRKRTQKGKPKLWMRNFMRIAGIFIIAILTGITLYLYQDRELRTQIGLSEVVIKVACGEKAFITLPDSSTVYLNSGSTLSYQQNYGYADRKVKFSGEGFFNVQKATKPFAVNTQYLNIEVLGTSFNVYAYEDENTIEMTLVQGLVKIQTNSTPIKEVLVKPEQKAIYDKSSGELALYRTNTKFETAWLRGELVFRSHPIEDVLSKIERRFGVKIHVEGDGLEGDRFTGYFDKDLIGTLDDLKKIYEFRYKIRNEDVYIFAEN